MSEINASEKTKAFQDLAVSNLSAMRLLRDFGLLRKSKEPRDKKAWGKLAGKERSFRNIAEHCLVVAMLEDVLLESLEEKGHISAVDRKKGVKAAILHDLTKRQELEATYGVETKEGKFINPEEKKLFIKRLIEQHNISSEDKETLSLTGLTGDAVLFLSPQEEINISSSPEELIKWTIFLTDYMVAHDQVVSPRERIREATERMMEKGEYNENSLWWFEKLYGRETSQRVLEKQGKEEIINRTYDPIKRCIIEVEDQLKELLGVGDKSILDFIQENIDKRYQASTF